MFNRKKYDFIKDEYTGKIIAVKRKNLWQRMLSVIEDWFWFIDRDNDIK